MYINTCKYFDQIRKMKIPKTIIFFLIGFLLTFCQGNIVKAYIDNPKLLIRIERRLNEKIQGNPNYIEKEFGTVRPIPPRAKVD